jgi:phospholysine phosphohistidine inorganic pyrophosphate phosphatase
VADLHPALADVHGLLLDLDGTLYQSGAPLPGAVATVRALERAGVPLRFVTNTTSKSRASVAEKLVAMGFRVDEAAIFSPPHAAGELLRARGVSVHLLVPDATRPDFDGIPEDATQPDAVVIGDLGTDWTFERLNRAFRLVHGGADLVALGRTRYWQTDAGLQLDVGPFVAALEYATGREALVIGKPEPQFFLDAVAELGLAPEAVALVGDDAETDVRAAQRAGLTGVLVRTGKFREADLESEPPIDLVLGSVVDLLNE